MNKNIKLAVAGAVLALSASANAGIIIPAGDWTLDIGGNVNTFATSTRVTGSTVTGGGIYGSGVYGDNDTGAKNSMNITTGLLPNYLSVSGTTRQNDLDVAFTISINPGTSTTRSGLQAAQQENRQAFMTFGDKSWGTFKLGKDIGIFAQNAILNDMTLLGVGRGAGGLAGNTTTTGRIGSGYMYADWKPQINYTTPNMSGFQATVGISQAWNAWTVQGDSAASSGRGEGSPALDFGASYSFSGDAMNGKVWTSATRQRVKSFTFSGSSLPGADDSAYAADVGANVNVAGFGLTGYYYKGEGIGQTHQLLDGFDSLGKRRDSDGGYVQATYVLPSKTKLGVAWGQSNLDQNGAADTQGNTKDELTTVGAYHPLTKHLNIVAEYNDAKHEVSGASSGNANGEAKAKTVSLGAILFF
jgi:predicted porin